MHRTSRELDSTGHSGPCRSCWASITRPSPRHWCQNRKKADHVVRFLLFLLGMLTADRRGPREAAWYGAGGAYAATEPGPLDTDPEWPPNAEAWPREPGPLPPRHPDRAGGGHPQRPGRWAGDPGPRRRRIPRWAKMTAVVVVAGEALPRAAGRGTAVTHSAARYPGWIQLQLTHVPPPVPQLTT